ncbi:MAG: leucine-rich repeat domain-containing protein [Promethearchaeati archaeon]
MTEFRVNKFITLRLEGKETVIYVKKERFRQCKYLFLIDPRNTVDNDINSIDEAAESFEKKMEGENFTLDELGLTSEDVFWGHCSNLQAWAENGYDTRLIHSNLAFPLLRVLAEKGDPQARKVFKEEIARRFLEGSITTKIFLMNEGFLDILTIEELESIIPSNIISKIKSLKNLIGKRLKMKSDIRGVGRELNAYSYEEGYITGMKFSCKTLDKFPEILRKFSELKMLEMALKKIEVIPEWINELKKLKTLNLSSNAIRKIPDLSLPELETLRLSYNQLETIDFSGSDLPILMELYLSDNRIHTIKGLKNLKKLKMLSIWRNQINDLPNDLLKLPKLFEIRINNLNPIKIDEDSVAKELKKKGVEIY